VKTPATLPLQDLKANFGNSEGFRIQTDSGRGSGGQLDIATSDFPSLQHVRVSALGGLGLGLLKETVKLKKPCANASIGVSLSSSAIVNRWAVLQWPGFCNQKAVAL
jgi:hypothetical protein